jgi:hypothetical protein
MSPDIFLQSFSNGGAGGGDPEAALRVLEPYLTAADDADGRVRVRTDDGEADVYGLGDGLMVNHASGQLIWQVLVDVSAASDYAIMPIGHPVCVTRKEMIDQLPPELRDAAVVIGSGADLISVMTDS